MAASNGPPTSRWAGGKTLSNEVLLDGSPNTSVDRGYMAYTPPVDSTQEFKVEANPFSAEFDRTTGGVVNIVTKGGTNEFHGTVYEFRRNSSLDARDFFLNRSGSPVLPSWQRNQYGGNIGGRLIRNRAFFFLNYEGVRQSVPYTQFSTVPTLEQRRGDFSETRTAAGALITIYDPLSPSVGANGAVARMPFPNNIIPSGRFDAVGARALSFYPEPNLAGDPFTWANNYISTDNATSNTHNYGGRIDYNIGQANRLFGRYSRNLLDTDKNNFAPRFGFAFQVNDKTAVRAGYGIFYAPQWISAYDTNVYSGFNNNTEWVTTLDNGVTPLYYFSNPFPQGFNLPQGDRDPLTNIGQGISGWTRGERVGYSQQWNFTIQRQFGQTFLLEGAYWGNRALKQENRSGWQENQLPNEYLALGNQLNQLAPNPFHGVIERGPLSNPQVSHRQLLLPYPQYTSVVRTGVMAGNSFYNAFTLRAEKRLSGGLSLLTSYTLSKTIDDFDARPLDQYNRRLERSLSATDVPQRLVFSTVYEFPFGRGRLFGGGMNPVLDAILGGWTLSGIGTYQSGFPIAIGRPAVNDGQSARLDDPDIDQWFDTSVFTAAAPFTFGNVGRRLPDVRSDSYKNFDVTLAKNFTFAERYRLRFRVDSFNVTNTPVFDMPNTSVTNAAFGQVRATANTPRSIQFGVHLFF